MRTREEPYQGNRQPRELVEEPVARTPLPAGDNAWSHNFRPLAEKLAGNTPSTPLPLGNN